MERIENYWQEIIAGLISIIVPLLFYISFETEAALSVAIGIFLAGFTFQAILIKANVENTLKSNLELYNLQTSIKDPIFKTRAQEITEHCLRDLKSLTLGIYEVHGPEPAFLELMDFYEMTQNNDVIKSVVIYADNMLLDGIYLERHRDAINRGAIIIKIFIVNVETEPLPGTVRPWIDIYDKIKPFNDAGVNVFIVPLKTIGADSRLNADFFLYKNIVGISSQGNNGMLSTLKVTAQHQDFDDYTHRFEELSKIANPFSLAIAHNYIKKQE